MKTIGQHNSDVARVSQKLQDRYKGTGDPAAEMRRVCVLQSSEAMFPYHSSIYGEVVFIKHNDLHHGWARVAEFMEYANDEEAYEAYLAAFRHYYLLTAAEAYELIGMSKGSFYNATSQERIKAVVEAKQGRRKVNLYRLSDIIGYAVKSPRCRAINPVLLLDEEK